MNYYRVNSQLWLTDSFFSPERFAEIKNLYRNNRVPFNMQYDNRLLTPWDSTPELQEIVQQETNQISSIVGQPLSPQVAYVSIDLAGSSIMMHRLHSDIYVQVQIVLGETSDAMMDFAFCHEAEVNQTSELDYQPNRRLTRHDVDLAHYQPNSASIYVNEPRGFVGMTSQVPKNTVREVLVLSYTRCTETQH
jgi:hypothetical protein